MDNAKKLNFTQLFVLSNLREQFEEVKGLRPKKAYNLNSAMLVSGLSTAVTYLIILLQFKTSEH